MNTGAESSGDIVSIVETSLEGLGEGFLGKPLATAVRSLSDKGLKLLYESRTSVLSDSQRSSYESLLSRVPKELSIFLDPIILSFALKDACDLSNVDYVWLDLEGDGELGSMVWVSGDGGGDGEEEIVELMNHCLKNHLEKYLIDAYDRSTREDLIRVWEAQVELKECPICGGDKLEWKMIKAGGRELRGWVCSGCGHHVIIPSDALNFLWKDRKSSLSR